MSIENEVFFLVVVRNGGYQAYPTSFDTWAEANKYAQSYFETEGQSCIIEEYTVEDCFEPEQIEQFKVQAAFVDKTHPYKYQ